MAIAESEQKLNNLGHFPGQWVIQGDIFDQVSMLDQFIWHTYNVTN